MDRYSFAYSIVLAVGLVGCSAQQQPLEVVQAVAPDFPRVAQLAHISGSLVVAVNLAPDGKVDDATVVSGPALHEIRQESVAAARKWVFKSGVRQKRTQLLTFEFRIEGEPMEAGPDSWNQEVTFLPPDRLVISVRPIELETQDPTTKHSS